MGAAESSEAPEEFVRPNALANGSPAYTTGVSIDALVRAFDVEVESNGSEASQEILRTAYFAATDALRAASETRKGTIRNQLKQALKKNQSSKAVTKQVIETPHPYQDNMDVIYEVHIPGARSLTIEFSPDTRSETNCDWLQLYRQPNKQSPVGERLSGPRTNWPSDPLEIEGDRLYFHWHTDGSRTDWGFHATVTGDVVQETEIAGTHTSSTEAMAVAALVRTVVCLLQSQSRSDPALHSSVIGIFQSLLSSAKPGSLGRLTPFVSTALSEFQSYLLGHLEEAGDNPDEWGRLAKIMLSLAIARGSQLDMLKLLPTLVAAPVDTLDIGDMLRAWHSSSEGISAELFSFAGNEVPITQVDIDWSSTDASKAKIEHFSVDGAFVFAATDSYLMKIGTGMNLTEKGTVYDAVALPSSGMGAIVLDFAHHPDSVMTITVPDPSEQQVHLQWREKNALSVIGEVVAGMEDTLLLQCHAAHPVTDGMHLYGFQLCTPDAASLSPEEAADPENTFRGLRVYRFLPDALDPEWHTKHTKVVELALEPWMESMDRTGVYTNGLEVVFQHTAGTTATLRHYDLDTGKQVRTVEVDTADTTNPYINASETRRSYDVENNIMWSLVGHQLTAFPNPGYARPVMPTVKSTADTPNASLLLQQCAAEATSALTSLQAGNNAFPAAAISATLFGLLDEYVLTRVHTRYPTAEEKRLFFPKSPFVWELEVDTFPVLFRLLQQFTEAAKTDPTVTSVYQLLVAIHMLNANLVQLATFDMSAEAYGLTPELAASFMELCYTLIDLDLSSAGATDDVTALVSLVNRDTAAAVAAGFKVLVPEQKAQVTLFASLLEDTSELSAGKRELLHKLLTQAMGSLIEGLADPEHAQSTTELLPGIVSQMARTAATSLASAALADIGPDSGVTVAQLRDLASNDTPSALVVFLRETQSVIRESEDPRLISLKIQYAVALLSETGPTVDAIAAHPAGWDAADAEMRDAYRDMVVAEWKRQIGTLLPGVLVDLAGAVNDSRYAGAFQGPMMSAAAALEKLVTAFPYDVSAPTGFETIETPHPYSNNMDLDWTFNLNAPVVQIAFDPQCKTERTHDWIQVRDAEGKETRWSGTDWPQEPVEVAGPEVYFKFHSDGSNVEWGVLLTVSAVGQVPWVVGLQNILSSLTIGSVSALLKAPQQNTSAEWTAHRAWLRDQLFDNGLLVKTQEDVDNAVIALLEDAMAHGDQSAAIGETMLALAAPDKALTADADAPMQTLVEKSLFAAFLGHVYHSRSVADVPRGAGAGPVAPLAPAHVMAAWRSASDAVMWLRRKVDGVFAGIKVSSYAKGEVNAVLNAMWQIATADLPAPEDGDTAALAERAARVCAGLDLSEAAVKAALETDAEKEVAEKMASAGVLSGLADAFRAAVVEIGAFDARVAIIFGLAPCVQPAAKQYLLRAARRMRAQTEVFTPLPGSKQPSKAKQRWKMAIKYARATNSWSFWRGAMASGIRKRSEQEAAAEKEGDPYKSVNGSIVSFLQDEEVDRTILNAIIEGNAQTAVQRTQGIQGVLAMIGDGTRVGDFTLSELLHQLLTSLAGYSYREDTYGVTPLVISELQTAYFELMTVLAKLLTKNDVNPDVALLILQLWNAPVRGPDRDKIVDTKIFQALSKFLFVVSKDAEQELARRCGIAVFTALANQCVERDVSEGWEQVKARAQVVYASLLGRCHHIVQGVVGDQNNVIGTAESGYLYDMFSLLCVVWRVLERVLPYREPGTETPSSDAGSPGVITPVGQDGQPAAAPAKVSAANAAISTPDVIGMFASALEATAHTDLQTQIIEVLSLLLGAYPVDTQAMVNGDIADEALLFGPNNLPVVEYFARLAGYCAVAPTDLYADTSSVGVGGTIADIHSGQGRAGASRVSYAATTLLRRLQRLPAWAPVVSELLERSLASMKRVLAFVAEHAQNPAPPAFDGKQFVQLVTLVGGMAVLGGNASPVLIPGSQAYVRAQSEIGRVLGFREVKDGNTNTVLVAWGSGTGRKSAWVTPTEVDPRDVVAPVYDGINLEFQLVHDLLSIKDQTVAHPGLQLLFSDLHVRVIHIAEAIVQSRPELCRGFVEAGMVPELLRMVLSAGTITTDERRVLCQMIPLIEARHAQAVQSAADDVAMMAEIGGGALHVEGVNIGHAFAYPDGFQKLVARVEKDDRADGHVSDAVRSYWDGLVWNAYSGVGVATAGTGMFPQPSIWFGPGDDGQIELSVSVVLHAGSGWDDITDDELAAGIDVVSWDGPVPLGVVLCKSHEDRGGHTVVGVKVAGQVVPVGTGEYFAADSGDVHVVLVARGNAGAGQLRITAWVNTELNGQETVEVPAISSEAGAPTEVSVGTGNFGGLARVCVRDVRIYGKALGEQDVMGILNCYMKLVVGEGTTDAQQSDAGFAEEFGEGAAVTDRAATNKSRYTITEAGTKAKVDLEGALLLTPWLAEAPEIVAQRVAHWAVNEGIAGVMLIGSSDDEEGYRAIEQVAPVLAMHGIALPIVCVRSDAVESIGQAVHHTEAIKNLMEMGAFRLDNCRAALEKYNWNVIEAVDALMGARDLANSDTSLITMLAKEGAGDTNQAGGCPVTLSSMYDPSDVDMHGAHNAVTPLTREYTQTGAQIDDAVGGAWLDVHLEQDVRVSSVVVRDGPGRALLRDIVVQVWKGTEQVYASQVLNPQNTLKNPDSLLMTPDSLDTLVGDRVRVIRMPDPELVGLESVKDVPGAVSADPGDEDRFALAVGSVQVLGKPVETATDANVKVLNGNLAVHSYTGGNYSDSYAIANVLSGGNPHCSEPGANWDLVLKLNGDGVVQFTSLQFAHPTGCTAPLGPCAVWVHKTTEPGAEPDIGYTEAYNDWDGETLVAGGEGEAVSGPYWIDVAKSRVLALPRGEATQGNWLHLKFIAHQATSPDDNIDVGKITIRGTHVVPAGEEGAAAAAAAAGWTPSALSTVSGATTYCDQPSDEELMTQVRTSNTPLLARLVDVAFNLQHGIVAERLGELSALTSRKVANYARQSVIGHLLSHWPTEVPLTVDAVGDEEELATYVLSFVKNEKPLEFLLLQNRQGLKLTELLTTVNEIVVNTDEAKARAFLLRLLEVATKDHGDDELMRYASLVVLQEIVLAHADVIRAELERIHAAVIRWVWRTEVVEARTTLLGLLLHVLGECVNVGVFPSTHIMQAYSLMHTHLLAQRDTQKAIETTYVQALVECVLMGERVKQLRRDAENQGGDGAGVGDGDAETAADDTAAAEPAPVVAVPPSCMVSKSEHGTVEEGWKCVRSGSDRATFAGDRAVEPTVRDGKRLAYFEATLVQFPPGSSYMAIGLLSSTATDYNSKHLGICPATTAMHSDDGAMYTNNTRGQIGERYEQGDVIGCGVDFANSVVFYTKNGTLMGPLVNSFDMSSPFFAACTLNTAGISVRFNFEEDSWRYNPFDAYTPTGSGNAVSGKGADAGAWWNRVTQLDKVADALLAGDLSLATPAVLDAAYNPKVEWETTIETPHPYDNNMDEEWSFVCPGAEYLTLRFDSQCVTENNYDYLMLYTQPGRVGEVRPKLTGSTDNWPSEVRVEGDRVYLWFHSDGSNNAWGFKVHISAPNKDAGEGENKVDVNEVIGTFDRCGWTFANDKAAVTLIDSLARKYQIAQPWKAPQAKIREALEKHLEEPGSRQDLDIDTIMLRMPLLSFFNTLVEEALPLVNLVGTGGAGEATAKLVAQVAARNAAIAKHSEAIQAGEVTVSRLEGVPEVAVVEATFGTRIRVLSALIFEEMKQFFFDVIVKRTRYDGSMPEVTVSRIRAMRQRERFTDIYDTLYGQFAKAFRSPDMYQRLRLNDRAWKVGFRGEGSIDAGGPYRETITMMASELESSVGLFQLCPNGRFGVGLNQGTHMPIPKYKSEAQLDCYRWAGRLIGVALRTKGCMEFNLSPFVWKALLGQQLGASDLEEVDRTTVKALAQIRDIDAIGVDAETFGDLFFETFTTSLPDGSTVELCEGGSSMDLTYDNRSEYCDLVVQAQVNAYTDQINAMKAGINDIVPLPLLQGLFSWQQLELAVCGHAEMDVDLLIRHTEYKDGVSAEAPEVVALFEILREMTPEDQGLFLRFVWGRSRLPLNDAEFTQTFKIARTSRNADTALPSSHSCFFQIDWITGTKESMQSRLYYAIRNCYSIDADSDAVDRSDWK